MNADNSAYDKTSRVLKQSSFLERAAAPALPDWAKGCWPKDGSLGNAAAGCYSNRTLLRHTFHNLAPQMLTLPHLAS